MLAFADMMKKGIVMPAHFVDDGVHSTNNNGANLFVDYATVADNIGVYTTTDYANIVDHLVSVVLFGCVAMSLRMGDRADSKHLQLLACERTVSSVSCGLPLYWASLVSETDACLCWYDCVCSQVRRWRVVEIQGLSGEAAAAQEYLCQHANRIRRLANIQAERRLRDRKRGKTRISSFDWLWGRQVNLS